MKHTFKYLGITTAALLISLEAVSVDAHTQQTVKVDSVPNVELLAQLGQFPRRTLGDRRTPAMARAIGLRPQGKVRVTVANGQVVEIPRGRISSIHVGDAQLNDLTVLIADLPLLGQNFFSEYNFTVGRDFIVFRQRLR
jgi:hypothetical protein